MEIFGIGMPEMVIIMIAALVFLGPEKLPEVAKTVGGWVREVRSLSSEATSIWRETIEVPETIRNTVMDSTRPNRGSPTAVPYVPPLVAAAQAGEELPDLSKIIYSPSTNGNGAEASLSYPAPFSATSPATATEVADEDLDYPAPFK